ncbi:MAG: hypothetical protein QW757_02320 [Candidatus Woesearchaeota archaeon]
MSIRYKGRIIAHTYNIPQTDIPDFFGALANTVFGGSMRITGIRIDGLEGKVTIYSPSGDRTVYGKKINSDSILKYLGIKYFPSGMDFYSF